MIAWGLFWMLFMPIRARRRLWHWRCAHYWSIIRLRRRVVFGGALLGALVALTITANTKSVFSSGATILDNGVDAQGVIINPPQNHETATNGSDGY